MKFVDEVRIFAKSGSGGRGAVAWLREKLCPFGGPAGGDGGKGGDVVFVADENLGTLLDLATHAHMRGRRRAGQAARTAMAPTPRTSCPRAGRHAVFDDDTGELLHDLRRRRAVVAPRAGRAAAATRTSRRRRTRRRARTSRARPGEERNLRLELKLLADVGLSASERGQEHALSRVSAAQPEDRGLSVHHARAEPRRRARGRGAHVRDRGHPGPHRRRERGRRPRASAS